MKIPPFLADSRLRCRPVPDGLRCLFLRCGATVAHRCRVRRGLRRPVCFPPPPADTPIRLLRSFIRGIRHSGLKEIPRFVPEESAHALGLEREIEHTLAAYRQQLFDEATRQKYYQLLLDHVDTGIVSCDGEGHVEWMNRAATAQVGTCRRVPEEWLRRSGPEARVVPVERHGQTKDLLLSSTRFTLDNRPRILFTLKDIHHVLEEQQLESWKTLTRVLTHEIMNSLTPILSLSETLTRQAPTAEPSANSTARCSKP